jgi:hypothetical protein
MDFINQFLTWQSLVAFLLGLLPGGYFAYRLVRFIVRKEVRLFQNLQRTVYLIKMGKEPNLQREHELIRQAGIFTLHHAVLDYAGDKGILETIKGKCVMVLGYSEALDSYRPIIERATRSHIPIIVIAQPNEISPDHMAAFREYPYFEMCNTSARLLTTIFNLSAVTPYEEK